ncbi:F-box-like protein [Ceratobasidium sp. AG-Ba]|nr:F-box-like protein [Ceratobasidium sp. AG-Ba]
MLDKERLHRILDCLQSPTYGAPSSELQLAALQTSKSPTDAFHVSFDNLRPAHVKSLQTTIQQLDEDATMILALHARLQDRIQQAKGYYQKAVAALAPINRFPTEVLARIFIAGKHLEINFCVRMSWVAKRWRDVALSTPELWNRIPLTGLARVSTYLDRSGITPIDIEVDARTYKVSIFTIRQSIGLLEQHMHRWRDVKVLLEEHEQAQLIIGPLEGLCKRICEKPHYGQLKTIRFGVPYTPGLISNVYHSFFAIPPIGSLQAIELLDVNLVCTPGVCPSVFHQMRTLSLSSVENMHLDTHLFGALSSMPNLASLILDQCTFIAPQPAARSDLDVILVELETLEMSYIPDETANLIFLGIHAPNLKKFGWYSRALETPSPILDWGTVRIRYLTLSTLKLRNVTSYATRYLLRWLEDLSSLTSLTIIFSELLSPKRVARSATDLLQLLSKTKKPCCPELSHLVVGDLDEGGLLQLQATIQAKASLQSGRVSAVLQPIAQPSMVQKKFTEWVDTNRLNVRLYECNREGGDSENGDIDEDSDDN